MASPDLNLLIALEALLDEGSVAKAAKRLQLSPSAMSRTLARLREATGDPLLVRAGRGLVPTPRANKLRECVSDLVEAAQATLRPAKALELRRLERTFTLRTSDGFVENFGPSLITRIKEEAPFARLRFFPKLDKDSDALRDGLVDLETGVVGKAAGPEIKIQSMFRDRFVGVVREGHPLTMQKLTARRYAASQHILASRRGLEHSEIDTVLASQNLDREIVTIVSGFSAALALARSSDLVATVPERHTGHLRLGMRSFSLPFSLPTITISMLWHPRSDADPAHRWLRSIVRNVCLTAVQETDQKPAD